MTKTPGEIFEILHYAMGSSPVDDVTIIDREQLTTLAEAAGVILAVRDPANPMEFFHQNVDAWGPLEWFDRMANAIREQDKAAVLMFQDPENKDMHEVAFDTCRMIAASSAMQLVRGYEHQVRHLLNTEQSAEPITLTYTNWRGETGERTIIPQYVYRGATDWHPEEQYLLRAYDTDKKAIRDFALKDFGKTPSTDHSVPETENNAEGGTDRTVLKYGKTGEFMCTAEHAVGEAYLLSCAEAAIIREDSDRYEIGHQLAAYAAGDVTLEDALAFMNEDLGDQDSVLPETQPKEN